MIQHCTEVRLWSWQQQSWQPKMVWSLNNADEELPQADRAASLPVLPENDQARLAQMGEMP